MKRTVLIVMLALACILGYAQSTNPLNYSGRMYVACGWLCRCVYHGSGKKSYLCIHACP